MATLLSQIRRWLTFGAKVIILAGGTQSQLSDERYESKYMEMRDSVLVNESVKMEMFMTHLYPNDE